VFKEAIYSTLSLTGATSLAAWRHRRHAAVLMYHGATDQSWPGLLNCERNHIAIAELAKQLRWIKANRTVISLAQYAASLRGGDPIPERSVVLTFDDGYENNHSLVFPLLRKLDLPAVFFIATDFIEKRETLWVDRLESAFHATTRTELELPGLGGRWVWHSPEEKITAYLGTKSRLKKLDGASRDASMLEAVDRLDTKNTQTPNLFDPMTPEQLRELAASGLVEIGAHSCRHDVLTHLSDEAARHEISQSRSKTATLCGREPALFSYPNGNGGERLAKMVEEANFAAAVEGSLHLNPPEGVSPYRIDRIALHENDTIPIVAATLGGLRQHLMNRG